MAVELCYKHPNINFISQEMALGTAQHEILASHTERLTNREVNFEATFHGVKIRGIPDFILIREGRALFLLDYNFSKYKRIFPSDRIQVDTYGFLLNRNHLNTGRLVCGIAIIDPGLREREGVNNDLAPHLLAEAIKMHHKQVGVRYLEGPGIYGQLYSYSLDGTKRNLSWATDYWKNG
jgi:hypothetical protein